MKTIIVPTDFSPVSLNAASYAADMAKATGASLLLFNTYTIPLSITDVPLALISAEEIKQGSEADIEKLKNNLGRITSGMVKIYTESVMGDPVDELEKLCEKIRPFAIVMGTKGKTGLEKIVFGSTALRAIRHLAWPVIVVPPGKELGKGIQKIGFACDFRKVVETTPVNHIKEIVKEFNAELHILNVDYDNKHFRPDTPEQSFLLHNMLEELRPHYHFINHKDIEDGITEFAENKNLDLLITIPKKHKLLDSLFKPSSTKQFIVQSRIPVLCVHE